MCVTWDDRKWSIQELKELLEDDRRVVERLWSYVSGECPWPYTMRKMSPIYIENAKVWCLAGFVPIGHNLSGSQWNKYALTSKETYMTNEERQTSST